ncbi:phosphotransferase family protein [Neobacillus citreus]|uniref:Phosphotransferase family protein n=1 Tax=Neobacillus citreus TaxID=2833578 RepID=A0A942STL7_9BACI|nr:phosphotransferase family protein [Neobacillus citreus]MCH6264639.1 phosphotransferase family protein [Neobacillus citreus]
MSQQQSKNKITEVNWEKVEQYLKQEIPVISDEPIQYKAFSAGYSNLTYFITIGKWQAVLRRPPFGAIPPKAHDMKREFDVLEKLNRVFPMAPKPYLYCEDSEIMERHFYVMEKKEGVVLDDSLPDAFKNREDTGLLVSHAVVDTLVQLHAVDYEAAGLQNFGYPDGYLSRQVHGWIKRFHNSKTDDIPSVDTLEKWLIDNIPPSPAPTIVHNDFKLNNMMFSSNNPGEVVGVFDWELSTIGDPLTDLASAIAYWTQPDEENSGLTSVTTNPGFLSRKEMLERYAQKSGRDISNIDYYLTFAFYKIAVILQQLYYRWSIGEAPDERFGKLDTGIKNLLNMAAKAQRKELLR